MDRLANVTCALAPMKTGVVVLVLASACSPPWRPPQTISAAVVESAHGPTRDVDLDKVNSAWSKAFEAEFSSVFQKGHSNQPLWLGICGKKLWRDPAFVKYVNDHGFGLACDEEEFAELAADPIGRQISALRLYLPNERELLAKVAAFPSLSTLDLSQTAVDDDLFRHLAPAHALRNLSLGEMIPSAVGRSGLAMGKFTSPSPVWSRLRRLRLARGAAEAVFDAGFEELGLSNLRSMEILTPVENVALAQLKALRELENLTLELSDVNDATIVLLCAIPKLKELSLQYGSNREDRLHLLQGLSSLVELDVAAIHDADLAPIVKIGSLRRLTLTDTALTSSGFDQLGALGALAGLHIRGGSIASTLSFLAFLPRLQDLDISGLRIESPAQFAHVARLKDLRRLILPNDTSTATKAWFAPFVPKATGNE